MKYVIEGNTITTELPLDFEAILTCGQTFRFKEENGAYEVFALGHKCIASGNKIVTDSPKFFASYFDLDTDYDKFMASLSEFDELNECIKVGKGIRILRQDLFEMIISFIISANNNIPRIKSIINRLCVSFGEQKDGYYAFPSPDRLAPVTKEEFRSLGAGFRDTYLQKSAQILAGTDFLQRVQAANTVDASKMLLQLPGVGPKVADCILLFGLRRWDCFPVDTWIFKVCSSVELDTPSKVRSHYLKRYGALAGLAQQYMFYMARKNNG